MLKVYEIECQECKHRFMWIKNADTKTSYCLYRRKGIEEQLISTYCPKCNTEIAIVIEMGKGINIMDKSIEVAGRLRGL